jgi:hypothetical protein
LKAVQRRLESQAAAIRLLSYLRAFWFPKSGG